MDYRPEKENNKTYFLENLPLFKELKKVDLNQIASNMVLKKYKKGERLQLAHSRQSRLYILAQGQIKLVKINDRGEELTLRFLQQGEVLSSMHFSNLFDAFFEFIEDASLLSLSQEIVNKNISENPTFASNIINMLAENVQSLMVTAEVWRLKNTKERLGWFLASVNNSNLGKLPISKSLLASYLGMTPESLSRALKKLSEEGIELEKKFITIAGGIIKRTGQYEASVRFHRDVISTFTFDVVAVHLA